MSPIKVGTYAISNINPELNEITYYSYMIIDIFQNKSFNVITLENIFNTSDILTIIQTKDVFFSKTQHDFETLKFKEFLENELFVNRGEIPEVLLDLVGKKYSVPNGEFTVGRKLIEGLRDYPYNHNLIKRLIKYLPEQFLVDLYEKFPIPDPDDVDDYENYEAVFDNMFSLNMELYKLYIYEGKFEPYRKIDEDFLYEMRGHLGSIYTEDMKYQMRETIDYDVRKKFVMYLFDKGIILLSARNEDLIEIFIEEGLDLPDDHIYIVGIRLFHDGDDTKDITELENIQKYHNFFFKEMDTDEVNESVDFIMDRYKELMKYPEKFRRRRPSEEHNELIMSMINSLRYPVMTKSASRI